MGYYQFKVTRSPLEKTTVYASGEDRDTVKAKLEKRYWPSEVQEILGVPRDIIDRLFTNRVAGHTVIIVKRYPNSEGVLKYL